MRVQMSKNNGFQLMISGNPLVSGGKWGLTPLVASNQSKNMTHVSRQGSDPIFPPRLTGYRLYL